MTDRTRVAITLATALVLGASTYGNAVYFSLPGALQGIWDYSSGVILGLAIVGVFLVYRWWALLPALAPAAVMLYLHTMTDYEEASHGDAFGGPFDFDGQPVLLVLVLIVGINLQAAVLAVGLLLRAAWERVRSGGAKGSKRLVA